LNVNSLEPNVDFYVHVMGFSNEGCGDGPYTAMRVNDGFTVNLAPYGSKVNEHLAFAMSRDTFDGVFARVKAKGIPYGSSWNNVGTNTEPREEEGARGLAATVYFYDPSNHLIEIRCYEIQS